MPKELGSENTRIYRLITRIAEGEIKIPPLQRRFVWKTEQIIKLLESIYEDYPIGSILLWETKERLAAARNIAGFKIPEKDPVYPVCYVLDGQQRLATLYGVFAKDREPDSKSASYPLDHERFSIYFDLKDKRFIHREDLIKDKRYLNLSVLLDPVNFHKTISDFSTEEKKVAAELFEKFSDYEIPIVTTKKRELGEVGIIFERINNSGTKLELFDLMVAWTWTPDFHLKEKFEKIFEVLEEKNFANIEKKIILQGLSAMIAESSKSKVIISLKPETIRDKMAILKQSLEKTIDFLSTQLSVKSRDLLPHSHQIVPLCYFFSIVNSPNSDQTTALKEWFWKTSFSQRYSSGTDTHIDEDIQAFKRMIKRNDFSVFKKYSYSLTLDQLKDTSFRSSNATSRAIIVLLANNAPLDLLNGNDIDTGEALSFFNKKEYHHVFPKKFLSRRGIDPQKSNSVCNICILPSSSNKKISDKAPSDYFLNLIPKSKLKPILQSNLLPLKDTVYAKDDFETFLNQRAILIIQYLDNQIS